MPRTAILARRPRDSDDDRGGVGIRSRKSRNPPAGLARVDAFLTGGMESLPFDRAAARVHAELRFVLRAHPIGERDLIIASIARATNRILITRNRAEFARVPGLTREDWMRID